MGKKKEDIISELYALRAGLSVVSQKADEVKGCEQETEEVKKLYNEAVETKKELEKRCESEQNSYLYSQRQLNNVSYNNFFKEAKERSSNKFILLMVTIYALFPISFGLGIIIPLVVFQTNFAVCLVIFLPLMICSVVGVYLLLIKRTHRLARIEYNKEIIARQAAVDKAKQTVENANATLLRSNEKLKISYAKVLEINKDNDKTIKNKVEESMFLDSALTKQYSDLLSPSDWQNIDLIISYLSTGRADTMKEALQLADRQRQTDAIVNEIKKANMDICSEIRGGFKALGTAMAQCFELLSRQLAIQHREILESQNALAEKLSDIKGQTEQMLSAQQLSNALKLKANVTSDQLRNDLLFMQSKMGIYR